jgi:hypothetical protein
MNVAMRGIFGVVLLAATAAAQAADPALLKLAYLLSGERQEVAVTTVAGAYASPKPGVAPERWGVLPGDTLRAARQPADRSVELYRGSGAQTTLVCRLEVRYYRIANGDWVPRFLLNEVPLVVRDGKGWKPFTMLQGAANLVMLTSTTLPNAEGYYPYLEFGLSNGATSIDGWVVK